MVKFKNSDPVIILAKTNWSIGKFKVVILSTVENDMPSIGVYFFTQCLHHVICTVEFASIKLYLKRHYWEFVLVTVLQET